MTPIQSLTFYALTGHWPLSKLLTGNRMDLLDPGQQCCPGLENFVPALSYRLIPLMTWLAFNNFATLNGNLAEPRTSHHKIYTAFSSQIRTFCPKVAAGPSQPSCPKVCTWLENAVLGPELLFPMGCEKLGNWFAFCSPTAGRRTQINYPWEVIFQAPVVFSRHNHNRSQGKEWVFTCCPKSDFTLALSPLVCCVLPEMRAVEQVRPGQSSQQQPFLHVNIGWWNSGHCEFFVSLDPVDNNKMPFGPPCLGQ